MSRPSDECRWNHDVRPSASDRAPNEAVSGHGLISTRWNGCRTIIIFDYQTCYLEGDCTIILRLYFIREDYSYINLQFIAISATL